MQRHRADEGQVHLQVDRQRQSGERGREHGRSHRQSGQQQRPCR